MRRSVSVRRVALLALVVVGAGLLVLGLAFGSAGRRSHPCTHGVSSIGPLVVSHGKVVGGDTTPHTQACLP